MIKGIGIDIVEIKRLRDKKKLWKRFLSDDDWKYIKRFIDPSERVAGFWAAKEALIKALDDKSINFIDVTVSHSENGKPYFKNINKEGLIHLSISHEKNLATAIVIWEK